MLCNGECVPIVELWMHYEKDSALLMGSGTHRHEIDDGSGAKVTTSERNPLGGR